MTLSSRHRIRNSSPGGLRPSTLHLGHRGSPQYWLSHVDGEETFFVSFKPPRLGTEPRTLAWKAAVLAANHGPPPVSFGNEKHQDLQMFGLKINERDKVIFTHLKLWGALARHNFKWVKIEVRWVCGKRVYWFSSCFLIYIIHINHNKYMCSLRCRFIIKSIDSPTVLHIELIILITISVLYRALIYTSAKGNMWG